MKVKRKILHLKLLKVLFVHALNKQNNILHLMIECRCPLSFQTNYNHFFFILTLILIFPFPAPFFIKHLPKTIDVMAGIDVRLDCILRRGIELVRWSQSPEKEEKEKAAKKQLEEEGFEGEFIPTTASPPPRSPPRDIPNVEITPAGKLKYHSNVLYCVKLPIFFHHPP